MNKNIIIWIIVSFMLIASVNAITYIFEDTAESGSVTDKWAIETGTGYSYSTDYAYEGSKSIKLVASTGISKDLTNLYDKVFDVMYYDTLGQTGNYLFIGEWGTANSYTLGTHDGASNNKYITTNSSSGNVLTSVTRTNAWHNLKIACNYTGCVRYIDNISIANTTWLPTLPNGKKLVLYDFVWGTAYYDNMRVWNYTLYGLNGIDTTTDNINISTTYPTSGYNFTTSSIINFNTTVSSTYNFNVSLYINNTLNQTNTYSAGSSVAVSFNVTFPNRKQNYTYKFYAVQGNDSLQNETSVAIGFYLDSSLKYNNNIQPSINQSYSVSSISINETINATRTTYCSLILNGVQNQTNTFGSGNNILVNFTTTVTTTQYNVTINCTDGFNAVNGTTSFWIDTIFPSISTNFTSNKLVLYNKNLEGWFNFTDETNVFSVNISIDGIQFYNYTNGNTTSYVVSIAPNVTNYSIGNHTLNVRVADGHTSKEIKDYDVSQSVLKNNLIYRDNKQQVIISSGILDTFRTKKEFDRYTFNYTPLSKVKDVDIYVDSLEEIVLVDAPQTVYKKWLITGNKWIDFMPGEGTEYGSITFTKQSKNSYKVTLKDVKYKDGSLSFHSIGDLNIREVNYTFTIVNISATYSTFAFQKQSQTPTFTIYGTGLTNSVNLTYNNTEQTVSASSYVYSSTFNTPDVSVISYKWINWSYYISNGVTAISGNIAFNQTVLPIGIDNCSTYTTKTINYTFYNATGSNTLNGSLNGYYKVWFTDVNDFIEFNLSWGASNSTWLTCISNDTLNLSVYGQNEFTVGTYKGTYYLFNTTLNSLVNYIKLYVPDGSTNVLFIVTDQNSKFLEGAYIHVLFYDVGTNTYKTSEILKTGLNGQAVGNIVLNTQWYKFLVYYNDKLVKTTTPSKIVATTNYIQVNLVDDFFNDYSTVKGVSCSIAYTNATKSYVLTYADPSSNIDSMCLKLKRVGVTGETSLNSSCLTTTSGTIGIVNTENTTNRNYLAQGIFTLNGNTYVCIEKEIQGGTLAKTMGKEGLFLVFLSIVGLTFIGIWNPIIAIVLALAGLVGSAIAGLFQVSFGILLALIIVGVIAIMRFNR